jgi:DMSO/TMAO reductase YedYZ molybdopterin-dependent catalytic subunit
MTSQATVWVLQANNGPIVAVASAVRDFTPGPVAHWLITRVGEKDVTLLRIGTLLGFLLVCAWIGTQSSRRPLLPDIAYVVLAAVGLACVGRLRDSSTESYFAIAVGFVTWIVVDRILTSPLEDAPAESPGEGRRSFLIRSGAVVLFTAGSGVLGGLSRRRREKVEQERRLLRLPVQRGVAPTGTSAGVDGIAPWRTSNNSFYEIDTALSPPVIAQEDWSLHIHGMVEKEITLTYQDLVARAFTEDWITLCCVSNPVGGDLIGNAFWSGVLIREILAEVGLHGDADAVLQTSDDGWTCGTPLGALTDDRNAMLALAMNGKPLPVEHGYPVRMVVPGLYGYVSATKWLVDIEVTRFDKIEAYWTARGWAEKGPILTQSRIDVPVQGDTVPAGPLAIGGVAWAQHRGIERVEYQLDGGPWTPAQLSGATPTNDTWVQWSGRIVVDDGTHALVVRATDKNGDTQTSVQTDVIPDGARGWHDITFEATQA